MNQEITKPAELMRVATDVAGVCKTIAVKCSVKIQSRQYVRVEGWQAIAAAHGCLLSAKDVERIDGGVRAIGEVRRISDGAVLATAEGFVGDEESAWGNRDEYAKRAMAQTRSMSRAGRSAFAHVVVLMDAGLETTPAEEVPHDGFSDRAPRPTVTQPTRASAAAKTEKKVGPAEEPPPGFLESEPAAPDAPLASKTSIWPEAEFTADTLFISGTVADVLDRMPGKSGKAGPYKVVLVVANGERKMTVDTFHDQLAEVARNLGAGTVDCEAAYEETQSGRWTNRRLVGIRSSQL